MSMSSNVNSIRWAFNCKTWFPTQEEWLLACSCVQRDELQAVNKYVFQEDSKTSLIGRLLMRKAAYKLSGVPYSKIRFARTEHGKPFVCNYEDIFQKLKFSFNISHHGDYCVVAAQNGCDVGVDIMKVEHRGHRTVPEYIQFMKNNFSSSEWEFLTIPSSEKLQLQRFFRLWCLKESYLKAIGTGLSCSLKDVSFHCPSNLAMNTIVSDTKITVNGLLLTQWKFEETFLDENHIVTLAFLLKDRNSTDFTNASSTCSFKILSFKELMDDAVALEHILTDYWKIFSLKDKKCNHFS